MTIKSQAERILFNPKLVVQNEPEGATLDNADGALGGKPYFYFGPDGLAANEEKTQTWLFTADSDVTLQVALETHPLVLMSSMDGAIALFDSVTLKHV